MNIAYTMAPGRGDTDLLLYGLADTLLKMGHKPCGTVQVNSECLSGGPCDMDVKVLPDGPVIRISQSLGPEAKGCRLDPEALETAVGHVESGLEKDPDCLIINKFGTHEAEGRGFRNAIAEALSRDIPVLVGLKRLNVDAFMEFSGGLAVRLDPNEDTLRDWLIPRLLRDKPAA